MKNYFLHALLAFLSSVEHTQKERSPGEEIGSVVIKLPMTASNSYFACTTFPVKKLGLNKRLLLLLCAGSGYGQVRMIDVPQK